MPKGVSSRPAPAISDKQIRDALRAHGGNMFQSGESIGVHRSTFFRRCKALGLNTKQGKRKAPPSPTNARTAQSAPKVEPQVAKTRVVILTAAQDETPLFEGALQNLKAYAAHRGGEVFIGGFTYQKGLFEDHSVRHGIFHQAVVPLLKPEVVELSPRLVWYGRANILPTAVDPLTGWDTNTRDAWAVFPHAKIALKSIPVVVGRPGKQIMTTGVITRPNYVQRNAGQKAEFHHTPGATIAEIKPDGTFFLRQLGMLRDGSFQDLNVLVKDGEILPGPQIEAITWGDIHFEVLDQDVADTCWGFDIALGACVDTGMVDDLKPKYQFFHDTYDFKARSHHTRNDPHERAMRLQEGEDNVEDMFYRTARFLDATRRPGTTSVLIGANHDAGHLDKWLKDPAGHFDGVNSLVWHDLNSAWLRAIRDGEGSKFAAYEHGLKTLGRRSGHTLDDMSMLQRGASYLICQDTAPIECGLHGDAGPGGAKGSPTGFAKIVERVNLAHSHAPCIREAAYYAGTSSRLILPYMTKGPTNWAHSEIVTYSSGKRCIVTLSNGAYRA